MVDDGNAIPRCEGPPHRRARIVDGHAAGVPIDASREAASARPVGAVPTMCAQAIGTRAWARVGLRICVSGTPSP
jgi:hypothetical protein